MSMGTKLSKIIAAAWMCALIFSALSGAVVIAPQASAHSLETDGNIGGVIHIDPDDSPVAGEAAVLFFELKDKTRQFEFQHCDCRITISSEGRQFYAGPLTSLVYRYTFPQAGDYQI